MILANYINDLLYRHDCVIVPNFGGFITNNKSATLNKDTQTFYPPTKEVSFNVHLKNDDGLLANYIASSENISFTAAKNAIESAVNSWRRTLDNTTELHLEKLGSLQLNAKQQLIFNPNYKVNYLTASFGLAATPAKSISRNQKPVKTFVADKANETQRGMPAFIKYAATAAILLSLGYLGTNAYQQNNQKTLLAKQEKAVEKKIQEATFVISDPLPTLQLSVSKEVIKPYHVVAGAFQFPENAKKKVQQLKKLGYNASVVGVNKWGLTEVAFESFSDKNKAINTLYKIQDTVSKDAWLLIKK